MHRRGDLTSSLIVQFIIGIELPSTNIFFTNIFEIVDLRSHW